MPPSGLPQTGGWIGRMDGPAIQITRNGMRRLLIEGGPDLDGRVLLTGPEAHHAKNVLRLNQGDRIVLLDGRGNEYLARSVSITPNEIEFQVLGQGRALPEPVLRLTLGQALLKADRMDLVVQKGTELGLRTLVPIASARSTVRLDKKRESGRLERWNRISRQALKQCRRSQPLEIRPVMDLPAFSGIRVPIRPENHLPHRLR